MVVDDWPDPTPGPGQVLVETIACGICGSDLHTVDHAHEMAATAREAGVDGMAFDPDRDLVMGHELSVRVLDVGPGVEDGPVPGTVAAAMPVLTTPQGRAVPGYDNRHPGGYAERLLLDPAGLVPVPNGLDPVAAALTEPMAVGLHAVNQSSAGPDRGAVVIGAGPVGLAVIAALSIVGAAPIVATDFSPRRRELAVHMGAHEVVDPSGADDRQHGFSRSVDAWRRMAGRGAEAPPVVFEAVGVPGMIEMAMAGAPTGSEVVVVGVCMEPDHFRPAIGIMKHTVLRFVLGWSPEEFGRSLHHLAEGRIDADRLVTGQVPLDDVPQAFRALAAPDRHVKILVRPNGLD